MKMLTIAIMVGETYLTFQCFVHAESTAKEMLIEPDFYTKYGKLPKGKHHELELLDPIIWKHKHMNLIHHHQSALNGRRFVCYPKQISTQKEVVEIFEIWAVGTAYTMVHGVDFQEHFKGNNRKAFLRLMREKYRISMVNHLFG